MTIYKVIGLGMVLFSVVNAAEELKMAPRIMGVYRGPSAEEKATPEYKAYMEDLKLLEEVSYRFKREAMPEYLSSSHESLETVKQLELKYDRSYDKEIVWLKAILFLISGDKDRIREGIDLYEEFWYRRYGYKDSLAFAVTRSWGLLPPSTEGLSDPEFRRDGYGRVCYSLNWDTWVGNKEALQQDPEAEGSERPGDDDVSQKDNASGAGAAE
ncbi:MAG: hypothetical protein Q8Q56_02215 [Alphaproteobacteria bacterium]|nr:hypothetical protein [Alphaproteobacteria bacterium]